MLTMSNKSIPLAAVIGNHRPLSAAEGATEKHTV
jgi:hypothetical protein